MSVPFGTAVSAEGPYARGMQIPSIRTTVAMVWVFAVCLAGLVAGVGSLSGWIVVAALALIPPIITMWRWTGPAQTMSESIQKALK